ncbi:MAG: LPS export ABC transporter permease LptG [candidate division KSB1 bacterium]|nr:LPS export ABC transporter permease LptG [candidate division KSB1 bacterium]MDZ7341808.1 LPS export ABC transporter permease LptG [candidate division KSB1 bacterium]
MKLLDQYILKRFLGTQVFALIAFSVIFIVIDLVGFLDKFIDQRVSTIVVLKYYFFYLPYIIILTLPVATLLASLFSVGQLARYNELVAMQASGLSNYRILAPLFILGIITSLLAAYAGERLVPYTNQQKKEIYETYVHKARRKTVAQAKDITLQIDQNRWLLVGFFDTSTNTAFKVSIQQYGENRLLTRLDAPQMIWDDEHWTMSRGVRRDFLNGREQAQPFDSLDVSGIRLKPQDIAREQKKAEEMSYWELKRFIREVRRTGGNPNRWLVDLYLKLSFPFANFIIILFGAPLASRKTRSGTALSFGISLFVCFLYFGIIKVGQTLGHNETLSPLLAAWIGNILFGLGAVYILIRSNR